jgi:pimeloyl-ACP methyl ester carboxylesterase
MMASSMSTSDTRLFSDKNIAYLFTYDFREAFRQGTRGLTYDAQLVYRDWGFPLSSIKTPIEVFHGTDDRWVPFSFSVYLSKQAPHVRLHPLEGEGHFCHLVFGEKLMRKVKEISECRQLIN